MVEHGLYVENLQNNMYPALMEDAKIFIVSFEKLFSPDGKVYSQLCKALNVDFDKMPELKIVNQSLTPRNATIVNGVRSMFSSTRQYLPKSVTEIAKKSPLIERMLYTNQKINTTPQERAVFATFAPRFAESQKLWKDVSESGFMRAYP